MVSYTQFDRYAPKMIADLMKDFNLKDFQAAGFPGNAGAESAGFTDIVEDGAIAKGMAGGTGWFQWTGMGKGRRAQFEAWCKRKGWKPNSYEANYSFLFRELIGTEAAALKAVRAAKTVEEATEAVCWKYERPAKSTAHVDVRIRWAKRALDKFRADAPRPTQEPVLPKAPEPVETSMANPIEAILANKQILNVIVDAVVGATQKVAANPATPLQPVQAGPIAREIVEQIKATPEVQHVTNTEMHWWQQRSKWSMIFAVATPVIALATGYSVPPDAVEYATTGIIGVGNAIAGFLALRAGQATKPLFS